MTLAVTVRWLAALVVVGFGLFLIGLAALIVGKPRLAERFLGAFAGSARAHYTEQGLRLLVGAAIVSCASAMRYPVLFTAFGWIFVVTTAGLLLVPWQWHQRFAARVMPPLMQRMRWFALGAFALGGFVLYGVMPVVAP